MRPAEARRNPTRARLDERWVSLFVARGLDAHSAVIPGFVPRDPGRLSVWRALGPRTGGFSLYLKRNQALYAYNKMGDGVVLLEGPKLEPGPYCGASIVTNEGSQRAIAPMTSDVFFRFTGALNRVTVDVKQH